jgi:hypothetical protein
MHCPDLNTFVSVSFNLLIHEPYIYVYKTEQGRNVKRRVTSTLHCSPRGVVMTLASDGGEIDVEMDLDEEDTQALVRTYVRQILISNGFTHAGRPREKI